MPVIPVRTADVYPPNRRSPGNDSQKKCLLKFNVMVKLVLGSHSNGALWEAAVCRRREVHNSFWDANSFCPIFVQVLYITYSLDISLKYA